MARDGKMLPAWGAYIVAAVSLGMSAWAVWLEPARSRDRRAEIEAQTKLMKATAEAAKVANELAEPMGQIAEMLHSANERQEQQRVRNEQNARLKE